MVLEQRLVLPAAAAAAAAAALEKHHDALVDDLVEAGKQMNTQKEKHKKKAQEMEQRAVQIQDALHKQIATEEQRIEERAQEMAAQVIQARVKGNLSPPLPPHRTCALASQRFRGDAEHWPFTLGVSPAVAARHKTSAKMTTASSTSSTSDVAMQKRV